MDKKENTGPWIFVSHSLKDWDKIRNIRNKLENEGAKPLLFFLKCLDDESEIADLIKREIIKRDFFLLCNSKNAEESNWVRTEVEFVKTLEDKVYETIDLDKKIEPQIYRIKRLLKRATVFVSYSINDKDIAFEITKIFRKHDYAVFYDRDSLSTSENWEKSIGNAIAESVDNGFFLMLLSSKGINSRFLINELDFALKNMDDKKGNIIPILLDKPSEIAQLLPRSLKEIQWVDFSSGDLTNNINELIKNLKRRKIY